MVEMAISSAFNAERRRRAEMPDNGATRWCQSQPGSTIVAQATSGPIATTSALYFRICL